jgi:hypothetical protein
MHIPAGLGVGFPKNRPMGDLARPTLPTVTRLNDGSSGRPAVPRLCARFLIPPASSLAALNHDQPRNPAGNAPWRALGPWSDAIPFGRLVDLLRWRHPGSARGLCRCCCGPATLPESPIRDCHASMRRPSRVPLPSLIRSLSGRRTDVERTLNGRDRDAERTSSGRDRDALR